MHVLVKCKFEEDPIKTEGAIVSTTCFFQRSRAGNCEVSRQMWLLFELVRDVMPVLVSCKFDEDPIKNEGAIVSTTFSPLWVYGKIFRRSRASTSEAIIPFRPDVEFVRDFIPVLVTGKMEEDLIKTWRGAIVSTTFFFPALKGR